MSMALTFVFSSVLVLSVDLGCPLSEFSGGCEGDIELIIIVRNDEVILTVEAS